MRPSARWSRLPLDAFLLACIAAVLLFWYIDERQLSRRQALEFEQAVRHFEEEIEETLARYEGAVLGAAGLFNSGVAVTPEAFAAYIATLELDRRLPAMDGITFTRRVDAAQREEFERRHGLDVFPPGQRADYFVVTYIEPRDRTAKAVGYDIGADPVRRMAAERARDTGRPALSGPVQLITQGGTHLDALLLAPLYRGAGTPETIPQRRAELLGWIGGGYHLYKFFGSAAGDVRRDIYFEVYDGNGGAAADHLLYASAGPRPAAPLFAATHAVEVGGRAWTVLFSSRAAFEQRGLVSDYHLVPIIGIALSVALWFAAHLLLTGRARALAAAGEMTAALRASEERYRQLFVRNKAVELLIDPASGQIVDANEAATAFYGWSLEQLKGMRISDINTLSPEQVAAEMARARDEQRNHFFFRHRLAGGEVRDVEVHSGPFEAGERRLLYSIVHDVTERTRAERALRRSERKYRRIVDNAAEGYWLIDADNKRTVEVNEALCRMLGYAEADLIGRTPLDFVDEENRRIFEHAFRLIDKQDQRHYAVTLRRKDGTGLPALINSSTLRDDQGRPTHAFAFVSDVSEQKRSADELRLAATFYETTSEAIMITDAAGHIVAVNEAFARITGYAEREVLGRSPSLLASGRHDQTFYRRMWAALIEQGRWQGEVWNRRKDGQVFPEWLSIVAVRDAAGITVQYMAIFSDITRRKQDEAKIWRQANYDHVTGLPNRNLFLDRLHQATRKARRAGVELGLMFVDLDRFKWVNDTYGHGAGDDLLRLAAARIVACVRDSDTVARLGGDEFTVIIPEVPDSRALEVVAQKILAELTQPFELDGREAIISASIGITLFPRDGADADTLIRNADGAMYNAKDAGRNAYRFFTQDLNERARRNLLLQNELRHAIDRGELVVYYQPVLAFAGDGERVVGAEALVRWQHPQRGLVAPGEFIPLAEETGLIVEMDHWVLRQACRQLAAWRRDGLDLTVAVNISNLQCKNRDCYRAIAAALREAELDPTCLKVEITERMMLEDSDHVLRMLGQLRALGIGLAVDDFGTGYSSLGYLKRFPVNLLKVDRSFVRDLPHDRDDAALVEAIMAMAQRLGLEVVGEGVETVEQADFLRRIGCRYVQGFLYSRPLAAEVFEGFVREPARFRSA